MLLNPHPLSTAGPFFAKLQQTRTDGRRIANGESDHTNEVAQDHIPKIDLRSGVPDINLNGFEQWLAQEEERFKDTKVHDEAAQMDVVQVAVSGVRASPTFCSSDIH